MNKLVVISGGFHPFHAGHMALYTAAKEAFPDAQIVIGATNAQKDRPFPFKIKQKLAQVSGVPPKDFVEVSRQFSAEDPAIASRVKNPNDTILIFARSEKDKNEPPMPAKPDPVTGKLPLVTRGPNKGKPISNYLQYFAGNEDNLQPMTQHAYMAYLPTVEFGPGITSASEIRAAWPTLNDKRKTAMVMSLYPATQKNSKLANNVKELLDLGMTGDTVDDLSEGENWSKHNKISEYKEKVLDVPKTTNVYYKPRHGNKTYLIGKDVPGQHIDQFIDLVKRKYSDLRNADKDEIFWNVEPMREGWSEKYKRSIDCSHPKGFSQKAHCAGKKKHNESVELEMTCPDCGMCETHAGQIAEGWTTLSPKGKKNQHSENAIKTLMNDLRDPHGYQAIDHIMTTIANKYKITPHDLHLMFVDKVGTTPDVWIRKVGEKKDPWDNGLAEGHLEELANTSLDVKEPKDMYNVDDRKQTTYKIFKFKSGKKTFLINFTVKGAPTYGKKQNWNAVNVSFGVKEKQDDYSFGDEINTDLTGKNKNQFLIYSTVINTIRRFITEYNTEIDEIIMQGAGERQEAMYQRFFQSAPKYFPGWHYDGKYSLVRDVPRQKVKKVREQGVAEEVNPEVTSDDYTEPSQNVRMGDFVFNARTFTGALGSPNTKGLQIRAYDPKNLKSSIGSADFIVKKDKKGNQWLESDDTEVNDEYRSKGVATMMYAFAKSLGNDIKDSPYQSTAGKNMWKKWGSDAKHLVSEHSVAEEQHSESCPHCGGELVSEELMNEKKDACYYKVKSRYKVWPSAYASGALVKCRKAGASNWGNGGKKNESSILGAIEQVDENLHQWFKEKWVRFGPDGKIRGDCARGDDSEGKPKCLPQSKAHSLGKKGRASAAARKRREDPNPERHGKAINVNTKKKSNESVVEDNKPAFMELGNMKPFKVSGKEIPGSVETLEKLLLKAKDRGVKLDYNNIDKMMQLVCREHHLTGDDLHVKFVKKHHMIPDNWIKKQTDVTESVDYLEEK
jgi:hypothetical protein